MSWTPAELPLSFYKDLDRVMTEERDRREADLTARYPRDYPRAKRASDSLRARLGLAGKKNPGWLAGLCGAVDPCGRPYVSVSLSQWPSRGGLRLTTRPDGEVPAFPEKIDGVPVYVAVSGCFGQKTPGCNGEPCVPEPDPVDESNLKLARVKKAISQQLGDLGEFSESDDASLPSGKAWLSFVRDGNVAALGEALGHTALRATLIGAGLWVAGARRETLVRDSVAGSLGVDAFILMWSLCQR